MELFQSALAFKLTDRYLTLLGLNLFRCDSVVVTKGNNKNFDVDLAAIAALEVRMLVCFSVGNKFHHFLCLSVTSLYVQIG